MIARPLDALYIWSINCLYYIYSWFTIYWQWVVLISFIWVFIGLIVGFIRLRDVISVKESVPVSKRFAIVLGWTAGWPFVAAIFIIAALAG